MRGLLADQAAKHRHRGGIRGPSPVRICAGLPDLGNRRAVELPEDLQDLKFARTELLMACGHVSPKVRGIAVLHYYIKN